MTKSFGKLFPYLCITGFLLHWTIVFILSLPSPFQMKSTLLYAPRMKTMFSSWRLFTPPYTFDTRLYMVLRDTNGNGKTDTIEVLERLALQKQARAPFNQRENILDHMVNQHVGGLLRTVWGNKKMPGEYTPGSPTAPYLPEAIAKIENNSGYQVNMATIYNYCRLVLKEYSINEAGKELKIVITKKMIRPFNELDNAQYHPKELPVFETAFKSLIP